MRGETTIVRVLLPSMAGVCASPAPEADRDRVVRAPAGDRGSPLTRQALNVQPAAIPGVTCRSWSDMLRLMPSGSTWQVVVPPAPVFGEVGSEGEFDPTSAPLFEIELAAIS